MIDNRIPGGGGWNSEMKVRIFKEKILEFWDESQNSE